MVIVFDLDDTLYNEIDFVKSGFKEAAYYLSQENTEELYLKMWEIFCKFGSGKVFDILLDELKIEVDIRKLVEIYRFHYPNITLPKETRELLVELKNKYKLGLITDGHYIAQKNKFRALGLDTFIEAPIFTDLLKTQKPDYLPYLKIMEIFGKDEKYVYIGDNPKKDFITPNALGWITIRYKNPFGIYKDVINNALYEVDKISKIKIHF